MPCPTNAEIISFLILWNCMTQSKIYNHMQHKDFKMICFTRKQRFLLTFTMMAVAQSTLKSLAMYNITGACVLDMLLSQYLAHVTHSDEAACPDLTDSLIVLQIAQLNVSYAPL